MKVLNQFSSPAPDQPRWFADPTPVDFSIKEIVGGPYPEEEVAISFKSNGEVKSAIVASYAVDEPTKTVKALVVGESGNYLMVALPSGSSGASIALIEATRLTESAR